MSCPTTRRHPRSLAEAFPDERACAIEHHRRSSLHQPREWLRAALFVAFLFGALFGFHAVARWFGA